MDQDLIDRILQAVDDNFDEQIAFTQSLVKIPSQRGQEHLAQDFMEKAYSDRGYAIDRWEIHEEDIQDHPAFSPVEEPYKDIWNVVGIHRPKSETGRSLILNGHIDVVPTGPRQQWDRGPYDPHIDGDWMYGRGAGDMKAGLVANHFALDALARLGFQPAATVYLQSVAEEECTGNGTLACLVKGYDADAVLIPEPVGEKLTRTSLGVLWFRVKLLGTPSHAAMPGLGFNAIESAYKIIQVMKDFEKKWNEKKSEFDYYKDHPKPINLNVGKIKGGDWSSSVPSWCDIDFRIACYPGVSEHEYAQEIVNAIREFSLHDPVLSNSPPEIEFNGHFSSGYVLEPGTDAEKALKKAYKLSAGKALEDDIFPGYLDAIVYSIYGERPSLVYGPISENIHAFNERVSLSSLKRVTKTIALFVADWCGLEPIN